MRPASFDIRPYLSPEEGQYFERKSLFEGPEGSKRARGRRAIRDQVAVHTAAFANAEGGVLVLGLEDDGTVTGHGLPADAIEALLQVPRTRLDPPLEPGFVIAHEGHALIVFGVTASDGPVQVTGDGFPLRMGDQTVQASESKIRALKLRGMAESYESHTCVEQMDAQFLPAPELQTFGNRFVLTLRNTPSLTKADEAFIVSLGGLDIDANEFRALLEVHRHGRVDNATLRRMAGMDTLQASAVLRRLRDRGLLELHGAGSASYYQWHGADRGELGADRGELGADRGELGADRGGLGVNLEGLGADRGELGADRGKLPPDLQALLTKMGPRPRKERLRSALYRICELRPWSAQELSAFVDMRTDKLVERHLGPMVQEGLLRLLHPGTPTHPQQAYRASQRPLSLSRGAAGDEEETR